MIMNSYKLHYYLDRIKKAKTLKALNKIVETASFDETITNAEYEMIYKSAIDKARL